MLCTSHNNSGRLQHTTFNNRKIVETETKQGHTETNRSYKTNGFNRYLAPRGTFSKIDHIVGHKTGLNKNKKIEIIPCTLSDHCGLRLVFNNSKNNGKPTYTWKLNNVILNDYLIKE